VRPSARGRLSKLGRKSGRRRRLDAWRSAAQPAGATPAAANPAGEQPQMAETPTPHQAPHAQRFHEHAAAHEQENADRHESLFLRFCDWTSQVMGEPPNIIFWLVLVVGWTLIFATKLVSPNANFLPSWFTGTAYNFPLNLITTVAELFIGFLVAAAANRAQRVLTVIIDGIRTMLDKVEEGVEGQRVLIQQNIDLTQEVHKLASELHAHICTPEPPAT
jgi:low affinity Fe/Cu permease